MERIRLPSATTLLLVVFLLVGIFPTNSHAQRSDTQTRPQFNETNLQLSHYYRRYHRHYYGYYGPRVYYRPYYRRYYGPRVYYSTYWGPRRYYRPGCYKRCKYTRHGRVVHCIRRCR